LIGGSVALNRDVVWLDTLALEHLSSELPSSTELPGAIEEVLDLYQGPLLGAEESSGPILVARDRLRGKFLFVVSRLANQLEQLQRWDEMTSLYLRAIEREPFEEPLRRGLLYAVRREGQNGQLHKFGVNAEVSPTRTSRPALRCKPSGLGKDRPNTKIL